VNSFPISSVNPWRNRAIVVWSGRWFAVITRNDTRSSHARSISREERTPRLYAYTSSATIIRGSYAARPHPSSRYLR